MSSLQHTTLTLFFTRRVGLHHWHQVGNLEREVEIYRHLTSHLKQVNFITYGGRRDQVYTHQLAPIQLYATPARMPVAVSKFILERFHRTLLHQSDIFKTNQIPGSEIAIWAKKNYGKKLIARCGYLYSHFMEGYTTNKLRVQRAYKLEKEAFTVADTGVVTSERERERVIETHHLEPNKIHVIPNYVITDVFKPMPEIAKTYDLACVSKAAPQKNLGALLTAMHKLKQAGLDVSLLLIGSASQDRQLRQQAEDFGLSISYLNRVANFDLPTYLNQAKAFILPSLYEGHPKALLEAMSCGLPCIGTNVPGIRDDLRHHQNGYLCQTDPDSLAEAMRMVLSSPYLQQKLGKNARRYVVERYSLAAILDLELALIERLGRDT